MRRILEQAGQALPDSKPSLELNPEHPLVRKLDQESNEERFADLAKVLFEQANLAEGAQLEEIGRASCRERVERSGEGGSLEEKRAHIQHTTEDRQSHQRPYKRQC